MKLQNLIKTSLTALALCATISSANAQSAEVKNVKSYSDGRTREITADIEINGAKNDEVLIIAYFYDNHKNSLRTSNSRYGTNSKQLCVSKSVEPRYYKSEYNGLALRIPESELQRANRNGDRTIYCRVKVYHENRFIDRSSFYYAISSKGYNNNRYDDNLNLGHAGVEGQVSDMIGGRNDMDVDDLLHDDNRDWTYDNFDNNNFDNDYVSNATDFTSVKRRALDGDPAAQYTLATYYANGKGVIKNPKTAFEWYRESADGRYIDAYYQLGLCYYNGFGITRNYYTAARWFKKGADCKDPKAMYRLGCMYYDGRGVTRNYRKAIELLEGSADRGNRQARQKLNEIY